MSKLTVLYALVRAQTLVLLRSMSSSSLRNSGSGLIISSSGRDPSHFLSKSRGSNQWSEGIEARADCPCYLTNLMVSDKASESKAVLRVILVMQLCSTIVF